MDKKLKIFLTGSGGFIGRNILEQLGEKYEFVAPRSAELDLTDAEKVSEFLKSVRPDLIIHVANLGGKRNDAGSENTAFLNLRMFFNLVRNKEYFGRMIMLGSGAEYDKRFNIADVKEEDFDKRVPVDQYGFYKYIIANFSAQVSYITHLRLFSIYGKYEDYKVRFISNNIVRVLLDMPVSINQDAFFEFTSVDDFIRVLDYFINNQGREKFYNIGGGERISLQEIGRKIAAQSGKNPAVVIKKEGLNREYTCDSSRLKQEIPDLEFTSIEDGIKDLFSYYCQSLKDINKEEILFD